MADQLRCQFPGCNQPVDYALPGTTEGICLGGHLYTVQIPCGACGGYIGDDTHHQSPVNVADLHDCPKCKAAPIRQVCRHPTHAKTYRCWKGCVVKTQPMTP